MARQGINKVIILGNLGNDPEVKYMPTGGAVTNISVATSESWKDKQTGQMQDRVEWHRIIFFNRLAEVVGEYLRKGSKVYVEGSLRTRKWTDQSGVERYTTEIVAAEMQMLDRKEQDNNGGYQQPQQSNYQPQQNYQPQAQQNNQNYQQRQPQQNQQPQNNNQPPPQRPQAQYSPQGQGQYEQPPTGGADFEDDIPFQQLQHVYAI